MPRYKFKSRSRIGFSLTEMSVVLAAAAAIIVVTVGGSAVVQRTRLGSVITDIKGFQKAIVSFENSYKSIPGDTTNIATLSGATAGNGNGSIDSASESLNFWKDLAIAGLIRGKFDGASTYIPGTGVPVGPMKSSGYNALDPTTIIPALPSQAIVIEFAGFTSASNSQAILTPEDAKAIDAKLDDGNPNTGMVRGVDLAGDNSTTNCATSNTSTATYNVNSKSIGCRLRFIVRNSAQAGNATLTGTCTQAGETRRSDDPADACPTGTMGKVIKTCRFDSSNTGTWVLSDKHCVQITCSGGKKFGEQRTLACMNGQIGIGTVQTCSAQGVWVTTSTNCAPDTTVLCSPNINGDVRAPQACNWSQTGMVTQTCFGNTWSNVTSNSCALITCSSPSGNVGDVDPTNYDCSTYTGFTNPSYYTGTYKKTCSMDGTWKVTSNACAPALYTGNCTPGTTADVDIGCAPGETGSNIQTCADTNKWATKSDTCELIKCSGERVGTARVVKGASCPTGRNGVVIEVCDTDGGTPPKGKWVQSYSHCATAMCAPTLNTNSFTSWPYAVAGANGVSGTCVSGYTGSPTRNCNADGTWNTTVTGSCTRRQCAANTHDNATWPLTNSLLTNVAGSCIWPTFEGSPVADCSATGTWSNTRNSCKPVALPYTTSLKLWLDAEDSSTVFSDSGCTTKVANNGTASCWKDKSGNAFNATNTISSASSPTYKINTQNGLPVLQFDGSNDYLAVDANFLKQITSNVTVFIVANTAVVQQQSIMMSSDDYDPNRFNIHLPYHDPDSIFWDFGNIAHGEGRLNIPWSQTSSVLGSTFIASAVNNFYVWTFNNGGGVKKIWRDDINMASDTFGSDVVSFAGGRTLNIGSGAGNVFYNGKIAEIAIYNTVLTDANRQNVEYYLGNKWGIKVPEILESIPVATPVLWLDAKDPSTLYTNSNCSTGQSPASGSSIGCWKSKGSDTAGFITGTAPTYNTYGNKGVPGITFDGSTQYLTTSAYDATLNPMPALSLFTVASVNGGSGEREIITSKTFQTGLYYGYSASALSTNNWACSRGTGGGSWTAYDTKVTATSAPALLSCVITNDTVHNRNYVNGVGKNITGDTFTNGSSPTRIGTTDGTPSLFFNGDINEILLYNTALIDSDRTTIENYLTRKWNIKQPAAVSQGMQLWLDATDSSTLYTNADCFTGIAPAANAAIACWRDKSGNGYNMTSANKPTYKTNSLNGSRNSLLFNGSSTYMQTAAGAVLNFESQNSSTGFFVVRNNSAGRVILEGGNGNTGLYYAIAGTQLQFAHRSTWGSSGGDSAYSPASYVATNTPMLLTALRDGGATTQTVWLNGVSGTALSSLTASAQPNTAMTLTVGTNGSSLASNYFDGNIGEIILYNRALSSTEKSAVEYYLKDKWGLQTTLNGNLKLWLDASDTSTLYANSDCTTGQYPADAGSVGCWRDKSGNNGNVVNSAHQPTLRYNIQNGNPVVRFDGTSFLIGNTLTNPINSGITNSSGNMSFFMAEVRNASSGSGAPFSGTTAAANYNWFSGYNFTDDGTHLNKCVGATCTVMDTFAGGTTAYLAEYVTGSMNAIDQVTLSADCNAGNCYKSDGTVNGNWQGDIGEIIFYDSQLSNADKTTVENYLRKKWNLP